MSIIIKPVVTEKMTKLGEKLNRYAFVVDKKANKIQIKKAVEELYDVQVEAINTLRYGGKRKSRFTRAGVVSGKASSYKKAIVTLAKDELIDFYSNI
ncbi:MAG: 50S ribosomal protein L23 [Bacteroidales bacterium]|nr:50S ribosomal protein L23 [Bacteroidales bacterium]MCF8454878.1 50S ribosomal protein L23 [Bacteroidales bacterium]